MKKKTFFGGLFAISLLFSSTLLAAPTYHDSVDAPTDSAGFGDGANTVATFRQWMVVGSPNSTDSHVTIYYRDTDSNGDAQYVPFQTIYAYQGSSHFGKAVAMTSTEFGLNSGETVLYVGAPKYDTYGYTDSGLVFVYVYDEDTFQWEQRNVIYPTTQEAYSWFGHSLDAAHKRLIVGAPYQDFLGYTDGGAAYLFYVNSPSDIIHQSGHVSAYGVEAYAHAGWSVAMSAEDYSHIGQTWYRIMVGSPDHDGAGTNAGRVELCRSKREHTGATVESKCRLMSPSSVSAYDRFGYAVSVDRKLYAVGAPLHEVGSKTNAGAVYLARWVGDDFDYLYTWTAYDLSTSQAQAHAQFGTSVSIVDRYGIDGGVNGDFDVVAGAPRMDYGGFTNNGRAFSFERKWNSSQGMYVDQHRILPTGSIQADLTYEGTAVVVDENRKVLASVPSSGNTNEIQQIRVYEFD